jgi:hypothetical protein
MYRTDLVIFVLLIATAIIPPRSANAEGALAVGVPSDVVKDGFTSGISNNEKIGEAMDVALNNCRKLAGTETLRRLCTGVSTFNDQCVSIAMDQKDGTPGAGWAIAPTRQMADSQALANCRATAGAGRRDFCKVDSWSCDGSAK